MSASRLKKQTRESAPHDMNSENAALMTREQVIDEVTNNRMRFVPELRHDTAGEHTGAAVPFEIDCAMRRFAVNLGPAMRTAWALVFGGNQIKALELRIVHDFFPQRSAPG